MKRESELSKTNSSPPKKKKNQNKNPARTFPRGRAAGSQTLPALPSLPAFRASEGVNPGGEHPAGVPAAAQPPSVLRAGLSSLNPPGKAPAPPQLAALELWVIPSVKDAAGTRRGRRRMRGRDGDRSTLPAPPRPLCAETSRQAARSTRPFLVKAAIFAYCGRSVFITWLVYNDVPRSPLPHKVKRRPRTRRGFGGDLGDLGSVFAPAAAERGARSEPRLRRPPGLQVQGAGAFLVPRLQAQARGP